VSWTPSADHLPSAILSLPPPMETVQALPARRGAAQLTGQLTSQVATSGTRRDGGGGAAAVTDRISSWSSFRCASLRPPVAQREFAGSWR